MPLVSIVSCPESGLSNSMKENLFSKIISNLENLSPNWKVVGNNDKTLGLFINLSSPDSPSNVIKYPDGVSEKEILNKIEENFGNEMKELGYL